MAVARSHEVFEHIPHSSTAAEVGMHEARRAYHFTAGDDAAGFQNAHRLGERGAGVGHMHEHVVAVGDIEEAVLEGEVRHVGHLEYRVAPPARFGDGPCQLDLGLLHVHAVQLAGGYCFRKAHRDRARPAAEVEDAEAGPEVGEQVRGIGLRGVAS